VPGSHIAFSRGIECWVISPNHVDAKPGETLGNTPLLVGIVDGFTRVDKDIFGVSGENTRPNRAFATP
jgi:hypothetical protein